MNLFERVNSTLYGILSDTFRLRRACSSLSSLHLKDILVNLREYLRSLNSYKRTNSYKRNKILDNALPKYYLMPGPGRKPTVSDDEILDAFRQASDPVLTTSEVADEIGLGHRGTFDRLTQLADDDTLEIKKVGETAAVWWYPNAE
jgi:hypothetical protein